jgi:hypothetical protein
MNLLVIDAERRGAIIELLAQPDPPELPVRGYHLTAEGRESRFEEWFYLPMVATMLQRPDISEAGPVTGG